MYTLIRILGNRQAGFVLGMVVVLNLAVGSLVMDRHRDLYPPFFPNDLNFFFNPVRIEHVWLYVLLVAFSLFGANLVASIIDSIVGMVRARSARLKPLAALAFHMALVLILAAHLYDGFYGASKQMVVSDEHTEIPDLGFVHLEDVKNSYHADGSLKDTEARLVFYNSDGSQQMRKTIAFNEPALFQGGAREVIIQQGGEQPSGLAITRGSDGAELRLKPFEPLPIKKAQLILRGFFQSEMGVPVAAFRLQEASGHRTLFMVLDERASGHNQLEIAGERYSYKDVITSPAAMVVVRHNPAIPLVLGGLMLSTIGVVLLIRWIRIRQRQTG